MKDFSHTDRDGLKTPTSYHTTAVLLRVIEQACVYAINLPCVSRAMSMAGCNPTIAQRL